MSGQVVQFPLSPVQAAWNRYAALARQMRDCPRLAEDEVHVTKRRAAYRKFIAEFERECGR